MNIICAPLGIVDMDRPGQGISDIAAAGFENILLDATMCCSAGELENVGKEQKQARRGSRPSVSEEPAELHNRWKPVLDKCREENLRIPAAYAPHPGRGPVREELKELLATLVEESIRLCGKVGCPYLVVRPLYYGGRYPDSGHGRKTVSGSCESDMEMGREWAQNREYYLRFAEPAKENKVMILLENQCRDVNGHLVRGVCADERVAAAWVDRLNEEAGEERFGFCMDIGACSLCGQNMREFATVLGKRIKAVILRDCDGHTEGAMLPFTCTAGGKPQTDWLGCIRGLREIGFDGQLILNLSDTAGAFSPLLRPGLLRLAKSVADYFRWQIGIENLLKKYHSIVLFGAGNMCRNYMKCYGEKYPPLFTCDNNRALWGTEFCGLEVRSPESLKELPKDCAIFICNIYYREIEEQLRSMGVSGRIEFFNDEYMPTFYFDRLERETR